METQVATRQTATDLSLELSGHIAEAGLVNVCRSWFDEFQMIKGGNCSIFSRLFFLLYITDIHIYIYTIYTQHLYR